MEEIIAIASLVTVTFLTRQCMRSRSIAGPSRELYSDADGTATRESEARSLSITSTKLFMNMAVAIGASTSVLNACYSTHSAKWSLPAVATVPSIAIWLLIGLQVLIIANESAVRPRFNQGICSALSAAVLVVRNTHQNALAKHYRDTFSIEIFCAVVVGLTCLSLPRRPVLYRDGRCVDQQNGASILALLSFSWYPLYQPSFSKLDDIQLNDLPVTPMSQSIRAVRRHFQLCARDGTLLRDLVWTWRHSFALQWALTLVHSISQFLGQYMLMQLLGRLEQPAVDQRQALLYALSIGLALLSETISAGWITWVTLSKLSIPMTAFLKGLIFEKMTMVQRVQQTSTRATSQNSHLTSLESLMFTDCASVSQACNVSQHCPKAIFKLLFDVAYLIHLIGLKHILIGSLFPVIFFPISKMLSYQHRLAKLELSSLHNSVSTELSELVRNLRQIRLASMENLFERRVVESKLRELRQIWWCGTILAMLTLVTNLGPTLLISVSLSSYALQVGHLSPSLAFASIGLFRNLHAAVQELPAMWTNLQESLAASQRIQIYLEQPNKGPMSDTSSEICLRDATISWPTVAASSSPPDAAFSLRNVNLRFPGRKLSIITGKTSSGKGLLLSAILGEASIESGDFKPAESEFPTEKSLEDNTEAIAFVSQPPWIQDCTIKYNILFGAVFEEQRYMSVLRACALESDLDTLPDGDLTKAGVNGGALSGGQKWRVSLARALYSHAQTIVLDDVLSAVDPHVARWICHHALSGELVHGRTIILATHHLPLCEHLASYMVTVEGGTASGRLNTMPGRLSNLMAVETTPRSATSSPKPESRSNDSGMATKKSQVASNRSAVQIFVTYLLGSGMHTVLLATLATFICRVLATANSWWLTKWTSNYELENSSLRFSLYVYLALSAGGTVAIAMHAVTVQGVSLKASRVLFQRTVQSVLHSPLRWIDSTSLGKLMQSLSSDMYLIDHRVAGGLSDLLRIIMQLLLIVFTSGIATHETIVLVGFMLGFYLKITMRHLRLSKRLNKLAPLASQPVLEHANSTESGILTIRAFKRSHSEVERMYDLLDADICVNWHLILGQRFIHGRYGFLGALFVCATAAALVLAGVDAATAGFTINIALQIKATMSGMMGKINLLTSGSRAIDRVLDVAEVTTEDQKGLNIGASWPAAGIIHAENITVRYDGTLPPVLRNVSFSLFARQRLGLVGRTGAGKTSLVNALLRFIDIEDGTICIDGVDITTIKLGHLRRSISIIPQDPFLFADTLRANLDIAGNKTDGELAEALLKVAIESNGRQDSANALDNLDMTIQPGGANLSHGQRQMVCLARAILEPRRIVILDEATSAVDKETDLMIQRVLQREFADSTIIVVAHKLATVAEFDKVLVIDEGEAVEFGSPTDLMNKRGFFWAMVNQSSDAESIQMLMKEAQTREKARIESSL